MFKFFLIAASLSLVAVSAFAQDPAGVEGLWSGQGEGDLTVDLTHVQDDIYKISIGTTVPMDGDVPGCGGGIAGEVKLDKTGGNFFVENESYDPDSTSPGLSERYCEIGLTFTEGRKLVLEERNGCIGYHGAACGFSGELVHDDAGL
ncbi:hypothetical protein [Shinella oryzae]|uniref:hypothetical protein n=1 Tax=Shinella oryzae TaxID=2871820 RepID=UPI001FF3C8BD|nr:hypothetical protein [Shinella oryzae]UPA27882.1 hypothetical protein K6301_20395 [Shinella oryzae]